MSDTYKKGQVYRLKDTGEKVEVIKELDNKVICKKDEKIPDASVFGLVAHSKNHLVEINNEEK